MTEAAVARSMKSGCPPTARHDRTGLLTPPGMTTWAAAKSCSDLDPIAPSIRVTRAIRSRKFFAQVPCHVAGLALHHVRSAVHLSHLLRSGSPMEIVVRNSAGPPLQRTWRAVLERLSDRV